MPDTFYAWSPIRSGGETSTVVDPLGRERRVVHSRNIIAVGEKVTQKALEASDEDWAYLVEVGAVRTYPYPETGAPHESPMDALRRQTEESLQSEEEKMSSAILAAQAEPAKATEEK